MSRRPSAIVAALLVIGGLGCSGPPVVSHRQPGASDPPFGGGFPPERRAGGDVTAGYQRRGEVRVDMPGPGHVPEGSPAEPVELDEHVRQQQRQRQRWDDGER